MVVSLTTTPMMCAHLLKSHEGVKHGRLYTLEREIFDLILDSYASALRGVLRHPGITILALAATVSLTVLSLCNRAQGLFSPNRTQAA